MSAVKTFPKTELEKTELERTQLNEKLHAYLSATRNLHAAIAAHVAAHRGDVAHCEAIAKQHTTATEEFVGGAQALIRPTP